jgi:RNA polymerase-binding transcription factor DksA
MHALPRRFQTRPHHPNLTAGDLDTAAELLDRAHASRSTQLATLAPVTSAVAREHRASVQRVLDAINTARAQVADGTYGAQCEADLDVDSLRTQPWAVWCDECSPTSTSR